MSEVVLSGNDSMNSLTLYGSATSGTCRVIVSVFRQNGADTVKVTAADKTNNRYEGTIKATPHYIYGYTLNNIQ